MFNILHQEELLVLVVLEAVLGVLPDLFDQPQPSDHAELLLHKGVNILLIIWLFWAENRKSDIHQEIGRTIFFFISYFLLKTPVLDNFFSNIFKISVPASTLLRAGSLSLRWTNLTTEMKVKSELLPQTKNGYYFSSSVSGAPTPPSPAWAACAPSSPSHSPRSSHCSF